jgi:hypothetical protein
MRLGLEEEWGECRVPDQFCRNVSKGSASQRSSGRGGLMSAHRGQFETIAGSSMTSGLPVPIKALTTRI